MVLPISDVLNELMLAVVPVTADRRHTVVICVIMVHGLYQASILLDSTLALEDVRVFLRW